MITLELAHEGELIALSRALHFVKFKSMDAESSFLAGSPYIGELYSKVREKLVPYYTKHGRSFDPENVRLEDFTHAINAVRYHISCVSGWTELSIEQKQNLVATYIKPLKCSEEMYLELLEFGERYHAQEV